MVVDASVVVDFLLNQPGVVDELAPVLKQLRRWHAPELIDAEVAQVIRRFNLRGELGDGEAAAVLDDLRTLPMIRYPHAPLIGLAFSLRKNATIHDGLYLALAQALEMPLLTRDAALKTVPGVTVPVSVL